MGGIGRGVIKGAFYSGLTEDISLFSQVIL